MKIEIHKVILFTYLCFLSFSYCPSAFSQAKAKVKKTFRADFSLPQTLSNRAFDTLFRGVYNTNLSINFGIKNFNTGVYAGMMQCQIFPRKQIDPHSIQTVYSAGLKLGYDIYPSKEKMATTQGNFLVYSPFLSAGYSSVDYSRLQCVTGTPTGKHSQTYSISGGMSFNLMFSEYDGIGLTIGYTFLNHEFNPDPLCLTQYYPNIREKDKQGLSQYLLFGLNWYLDLAKRDND
jgi:hypothetical protein